MMIKKERELTINQKRALSRYEREVRRIVFNIENNQMQNFSSEIMIPVSRCEVDKKFQTLKILLSFEENSENIETVFKINKFFSSIVRYELGKTNIFSKVPKVLFEIDKEFNYIINTEKLLKEN